jgi:hypothetical protein
MKNKTKLFGESGFNQFYSELFGSRWEALKESFFKENQSVEYKIEDCEIIPFNEEVFFNYSKVPKPQPLPRNKMIEQHNKKIPRETLKEYIRKYSFLECGRKCGVSDNAIRKWCKSYGLPYKKTIIDKISDQEWEKI